MSQSRFQQAVIAELTRLKARIAELEAATKAPEPFVPLPRVQIDLLRHAAPLPSAEVVAAGQAMSDVVADARRGNVHQRSSMLGPTAPAPPVARGSGYAEAKPLRSPAGVAALDRIMDEQDRRDREDLLARSVQRAQLSKPLPPPKPKQLDTADLDAIMGDDKPAVRQAK